MPCLSPAVCLHRASWAWIHYSPNRLFSLSLFLLSRRGLERVVAASGLPCSSMHNAVVVANEPAWLQQDGQVRRRARTL